jgi:transcriptional regulator with XRE-family HTH domain
MDSAKRKRLEQAGWQVGSVADFLGLTDEESAYIELRIRLVNALKARRRIAKLSQKAVAMNMKSSQSRIAKAESNDATVSLDLLIRSLIGLGVTLAELARIVDGKKTGERAKATTASRRTRRKEAKPAHRGQKKSTVRAA